MSGNAILKVFYLLLVVFIAHNTYSITTASPCCAFAQSGKEIEESKNITDKTFMQLRNERDILDIKIEQTKSDLEKHLSEQYWLMEEEKYKREQKQYAKGTREWEIAQARINEYRAYANTPDALNIVNERVEQTKIKLNNMKSRKLDIETEMNNYIDIESRKHDFKKLISAYFTVLIAFVIVGFFLLAWCDEAVRRAIFSGQEGIQFVTLFSLVIAIILFGVLGILEGKELAALLGGLSGYILGRATSHTTASVQTGSPVSSPAITSISPSEADVATIQSPFPVQISGSDLQLANSVKIVQGANELSVANIVSSESVIKCNATLDPNQPKGLYDVIVTNSDGAVAKLPQAFTVK